MAFDHTARWLDAFNQEPDNFVAFPPLAGRGGAGAYGVGIPKTAPHPEWAVELIDYLTKPATQV